MSFSAAAIAQAQGRIAEVNRKLQASIELAATVPTTPEDTVRCIVNVATYNRYWAITAYGDLATKAWLYIRHATLLGSGADALGAFVHDIESAGYQVVFQRALNGIDVYLTLVRK